jgi:integrase
MAEKDFINYLKAKRLSPASIRTYLIHYRLFQRHTEKEGLNQKSINSFINRHPSNVTSAFLRNFFDFFKITELIIPKRTGRKPKKKRRSISSQEIRFIRKRIYKKRMKFGLVFDLCYHCALRKSEVLDVEVENFDFIRWAKDKSRGGCRLKIKGKGDKERIVIVPPKLTQRIIKYMAVKELYGGKLFLNIGRTIFHRMFKYGISGLNYNYTIHDLRRSKATRWHEEGKDLIQLKNRLGHESISTTQLYVNPDEEKELNVWEDEF